MTALDDQRDLVELDLDPDTRPQDDLFGHVNGAWLARATIPDDRAVHGSFAVLRDRAEEQVRDLIEEAAADAAPGTDAARIGALYASFMDSDTVDARGAAPLAPIWERIASVADTDQLVTLLGELAREGVGGPLSLSPWIDRGDPSRWLLHLSQSGLGLPDESYYRLDAHAETRTAYRTHLVRMFELAASEGLGDPAGGGIEALVDDIVSLETRIAEHHWERADTRDAVKTYNLVTADDLARMLPVAPAWFAAMGVTHEQWAEVVLGQPDVVEGITQLLDTVEVDTWKRWLAWRVLRSAAAYLSAPFVEQNFDFYGRTLTGAAELRARWKRGTALVESVLGEALGKLYVARHYPPEAQAQMEALVDNLLEAYRVRISDLPWMEADTRAEALAKLKTFTPKIGKPKKWRDYSALELDPDDLFGNLQRAAAFNFEWEISKLDEPVDRDEWFMTPQTVNAYYNPAMNEIVFPAAILQPPFFDPTADPAYNYGAIGAVIGHEIGHGFDDQGSRYGGDGSLRNWWSDEDRERFEDKVKALVEQFDVLSPRELDDSHTVNGALTVGENIGDLGGIEVAYHAYQLSLDGGEAPVVDDLTGPQRFFVGWARVWRVAVRKEEAIRRLTVDPHSPAEFRTNIVSNVEAFHKAFGTTPDDALWLDPDQRVSIW